MKDVLRPFQEPTSTKTPPLSGRAKRAYQRPSSSENQPSIPFTVVSLLVEDRSFQVARVFVAALAYFPIFSKLEDMVAAARKSIVQLSPRGQITLPADVRKEVGFKPGDALVLEVEDGKVVVGAAVVLPVERYSEKRIREFAEAAELNDKELAKARKAWGV